MPTVTITEEEEGKDDEPSVPEKPQPNTKPLLYGIIAITVLVILLGLAWQWYKEKEEKESDQRRAKYEAEYQTQYNLTRSGR